jgi:hypothetical protein
MSSSNVKVCWITGSYYLRRDKLSALREQFGEHECTVYEDINGEYLELYVLTRTLFDTKRIAVLKCLPDFEGTSAKSNKKMKEVLSKIPDDVVLVIDGVP